MEATLHLITEQLNKLSSGQEKMDSNISAVSSGQEELKTVSTELKSDISTISTCRGRQNKCH
jgi:prefoldin subunit 5